MPVAWYVQFARILTVVEDTGDWPDGLLDAYIAMIPKSDGDASPLGQRPCSVLPIVYRVWASAGMVQLDGWFRSWVPDSVFSAGGGRGSVEAWYTSADVIKSFDTVDRGILDRVLSSLGLPAWSVMLILSTTSMFVYGKSLLRALVSPGLGMGVFLRDAL